jgi:8-oxo-dGTP pyrophosphatase MutT (NUDIX family)
MKQIICSGALFYSLDTRRFLFLHRNNGKRKNLWGLVGGTNEDKETPWEGLRREVEEEIGFLPEIVKTMPLETFISNDELFHYHTYICIVQDEFIPKLNFEHDGYAWVSFTKWPKPLHDGVRNTLNNRVNQKKLQTVFEVLDLLLENRNGNKTI